MISGAPRDRQCWMDLNNFPLTEIYWTTGALTTAISNSSSKLLDSWKESSDKSSWSTKSHGEGRNENSDLLSLSPSCHVLPEILLEIEWAIWVHSDLQWPNLAQAKQLPALTERRINEDRTADRTGYGRNEMTRNFWNTGGNGRATERWRLVDRSFQWK